MLFFFSDLQQITWNESARSRLARFQSESPADKVSVVQLESSQLSNLTVRDIQLANQPIIIGEPVEIRAEVVNTGDVLTTGEITLSINHRVMDSQRISLNAGQSHPVMFTAECEEIGDNLFTMQLSKDDLATDNVWFHIGRAFERIESLCVEGRNGSSRYVDAALQAFGNGKCVDNTVVHENVLSNIDVSPYEVISLCNVGSISEWDRRRLVKYVRAGGTLFVFLGDKTQVEMQNHLLQRLNLGVIVGSVNSEAPVDFAFNRSTHQVSRSFSEVGAAVQQAATWRHFAVEPKVSDKVSSQVALWFANGHPAILHSRVDDGSVFLVTTNSSDRLSTDSTLWTAWPLLPSFVPILHEMSRLSFGERSSKKNGIVSDPFERMLPMQISDVTLLAQHEDEDLQIAVENGRYSFRPNFVGCYDIRSNASEEKFDRFAVNFEADEANLATWTNDFDDSVQLVRRESIDEKLATASGPTVPFLPGFLIGTLVLLLIDSGLAWHYGRK